MPAALQLALIIFAAAPYPEDPFADEYVVPRVSEVGVGEAQVRTMLLGGVFADGGGFLARGSAEYTASSYFSVRASLEVQRATSPFHSARAGAGLHLLPYRRVDVGAWFEGGPAYVSGQVMPMLAGGLSLDIGLSTLFFLHFDAQLGWANATFRPAALAGIGLTL